MSTLLTTTFFIISIFLNNVLAYSITNNQTTKTTFINKYGTYGDITYNTEDTNIVVNNNNNNNITFNIKDKLNIQTSENKKDKVIDYINYLNNNTTNNNPSITQSILKTNDEHINETTRQMTDIAQISVAAVAVALSIITGGIGSGVSGAMMTAAATTAGTIATNTTVQTSLNAEGDIFKQIKDITNETIKTTTSEDSLKSIATSAIIAGISEWIFEISNGNKSLDKGKEAAYKPNNKLITKNPELYRDYKGVVSVNANNIGLANVTGKIELVGKPITPYSNNPLKLSFWKGFAREGGAISKFANKFGGMNSMATYIHDPWSNTVITKVSPILQLTIAPAILVQYCATFPGACGVMITNTYNNN